MYGEFGVVYPSVCGAAEMVDQGSHSLGVYVAFSVFPPLLEIENDIGHVYAGNGLHFAESCLLDSIGFSREFNAIVEHDGFRTFVECQPGIKLAHRIGGSRDGFLCLS